MSARRGGPWIEAATPESDEPPVNGFVLDFWDDGEPVPEVPAGWEPHDEAARAAATHAYDQAVAHAARQLRIREDAQALHEARKAGETAIPVPIRLDEFLARPLEPVTHRVEGLWPVGGRVLLAAQWKAGKTTLRDNLVRSLVDGYPFLGRYDVHPCDGSIVILDFELDERTLQRWLRDQQFEQPERVHIVSMKGRASTFNILDEKLRARWSATLADVDPSVIVIDCLRPILDALGLDENRDAGRFLVAFDEFVDAAGASEALVVHHMGHGSERSRGDSRLRDWPDAEWRLVRDKDEEDPTIDNPSGARYFSAYGRDVDQSQTELLYEPTTRWLTLGEDGANRAAKTQQRGIEKAMTAILRAVAEQPGINFTQLRKACHEKGAKHNPHINEALEKLLLKGLVRQEATGRAHRYYSSTVPNRAQPSVGTVTHRLTSTNRATVPTVPNRAHETLGTVDSEPAQSTLSDDLSTGLSTTVPNRAQPCPQPRPARRAGPPKGSGHGGHDTQSGDRAHDSVGTVPLEQQVCSVCLQPSRRFINNRCPECEHLISIEPPDESEPPESEGSE